MTTELSPYRHAEVVRIEECKSCELKAERRQWIATTTKKYLVPLVRWAPWNALSIIGIVHYCHGNLIDPMGIVYFIPAIGTFMAAFYQIFEVCVDD